ncbi:hypothetical protein [Butyrivibrio sp. XPD2002]|uniref:hypothetical protein n=1 Tax=Butyrivibrio sp. XPD2002 TaxID=1280665 RepID=UPI000408D349|nr:hypothetical protein [Butyrivibrio sp. XPD2002]
MNEEETLFGEQSFGHEGKASLKEMGLSLHSYMGQEIFYKIVEKSESEIAIKKMITDSGIPDHEKKSLINHMEQIMRWWKDERRGCKNLYKNRVQKGNTSSSKSYE